MGDAHRGLGAVDVLAAGPARTVDVDPQLSGVDLDGDGVIDLRRDEHRRERGMAPVPGVERRLPHQPVHAGLGAQPTVGVFPLETYGGALDAGHLSVGHLDQIGLESAPLTPAQVHAEQHPRPVLGLGAAGPGLDVEECVGGVHLAGEHPAEFQRAETIVERRYVGLDLGDGRGVGFLLGQGQQCFGVFEAGVEAVETLDDPGEARALAAKGLCPGRLAPYVGQLQLAVDLFQLLATCRDVKDTPSGHPDAPACP